MADFSDVVKELKQTNSKLDRLANAADPEGPVMAAESEKIREEETRDIKENQLLERIAVAVEKGGLGAGDGKGKVSGFDVFKGMALGTLLSKILAPGAIVGAVLAGLKLLGPGALVVGAILAAVSAAKDAIKAWSEAEEGKWGTVDKTSAALGGFLGGQKEGGIWNALAQGGKFALMGMGIGAPFGLPGILAGALIGGAFGILMGSIGGLKIAEWVDGTVKAMRSIFDMPEALSEKQKKLYKKDIKQMEEDTETSKSILETLRKQLAAEGTTYKERIELRKKIRAEEIKLHGIEDELEDKRRILAESELAHKDKVLTEQRLKMYTARMSLHQAENDLDQAKGQLNMAERKFGVGSDEALAAADEVAKRELAVKDAAAHRKSMETLEEKLSNERDKLRLDLDREHRTFAGNARLSVQGWKDTGKILTKIIPIMFKRWIFDPGSAGDDTGAGTPMKIFGINFTDAFKSVKEVLQTKWDKIKQAAPIWFKNNIFDPGGDGVPMRIFGFDMVMPKFAMDAMVGLDKLKTTIPQWIRENIFDPGSAGDDTGAGTPMKIFGMELKFPEFPQLGKLSAKQILDKFPKFFTDPVGYISDLIDDMMSLMPDFLKPEKDVSGMSSEEKAEAIIDIKEKMKRTEESIQRSRDQKKHRLNQNQSNQDKYNRFLKRDQFLLAEQEKRLNALQGNQMGGMLGAGDLAIVGEGGRELFMSDRAGTILSAGLTRQIFGGAGDAGTNIVNAPSVVNAPQSNMTMVGTPIVNDNPILRAVNASALT